MFAEYTVYTGEIIQEFHPSNIYSKQLGLQNYSGDEEGSLNTAVLSPNNQLLATTSVNGNLVRIWNIENKTFSVFDNHNPSS